MTESFIYAGNNEETYFRIFYRHDFGKDLSKWLRLTRSSGPSFAPFAEIHELIALVINPLTFSDPTPEFQTIMYFADHVGAEGKRENVNYTHSLVDSDVKILRTKASQGAFFLFETDDGNYYAAKATDPYSR